MKNIINIRIKERKNNLLLSFIINYDYNVNRKEMIVCKYKRLDDEKKRKKKRNVREKD